MTTLWPQWTTELTKNYVLGQVKLGIQGEKVNTTAFVLCRESVILRCANTIGTYFRLVHEPDTAAKKLIIEKEFEGFRKQEFPGVAK